MFIEERSPDAINNARVRAFLVRKYLDDANRRLTPKRLVKRVLRGELRERPRRAIPHELAKHSRSEPAALTRAMLKHAFRAHVVKPSDYPVIIIGSEKLNRAMTDPEFPINKTTPNRKIIVSGENHSQAVSSPVTARILQRLLDGEDADTIAAEMGQAADQQRRHAS